MPSLTKLNEHLNDNADGADGEHSLNTGFTYHCIAVKGDNLDATDVPCSLGKRVQWTLEEGSCTDSLPCLYAFDMPAGEARRLEEQVQMQVLGQKS